MDIIGRPPTRRNMSSARPQLKNLPSGTPWSCLSRLSSSPSLSRTAANGASRLSLVGRSRSSNRSGRGHGDFSSASTVAREGALVPGCQWGRPSLGARGLCISAFLHAWATGPFPAQKISCPTSLPTLFLVLEGFSIMPRAGFEPAAYSLEPVSKPLLPPIASIDGGSNLASDPSRPARWRRDGPQAPTWSHPDRRPLA